MTTPNSNKKPNKITPARDKKTIADKKEERLVRLNKYIANAGVCSRREADKLIASGKIKVNGEICTEIGLKITYLDAVHFEGRKLSTQRKVYLALNKPKGFVTTVKDKFANKNVMSLVSDACPERLYPVGRLDKETTGVLLLTNDGELTKRLTHPSYAKRKIYHAHLNREIKQEDLDKIAKGFTLEDGFIQADAISFVGEDKCQVGIEIHSGRNRIVRRIFAHLKFKVIKLDRVYFAGITKKNISRGHWRFLTEAEVRMLKHF